MITFRTPISISTPHTYISTQPFLPSQSPLSTTFGVWFTKSIKMQTGKLLSWPAMPLKWIGHDGPVTCVHYSPNGKYIISGSIDKTIRVWDAEIGAPVGEPLMGHTDSVRSLAYSPDGRHFISGSKDMTIQMWDGETGVIVGQPLKGHTSGVWSIAYSPDGQRIASGSYGSTIRIWDAETRIAAGKPLNGHTSTVWSVAYAPD